MPKQKSSKPLYRHILFDSWRFTRRHLFLWPLALFTSLIGVVGTFEIFIDIANNDTPLALADLYSRGDFITSIFVGWSQEFNQIPWTSLELSNIPALFFFFALLFLIIALAVIVFSSEGGLIYGLSQLYDKKVVNFLESFRQGLDTFWYLFSINLVFKLFKLIILVTTLLPLIFLIITRASNDRILFTVLVYMILIPGIVILNLVTRYSLMYIMIHKATMKEAFWNAWLLFRSNWILSIETALLIHLVLFTSFVVVTSLLLPLLILFFNMFGSLVLFSEVVSNIFAFTALITLALIITLYFTLFTAFQMSIWVGIFRRLTKAGHHSKVLRLAYHLPWLHKRIH